LVQNTENSYTDAKNMCLFSVLAAEADAIPASACLLSLNQIQLMSVSEGTKNFHHSFKSKMVRSPKTRPSTTFTLASFSSCLFNNVYCSFHYYPQHNPQFTHFFLSVKQKSQGQFCPQSDTDLFVGCLIWAPQQPKSPWAHEFFLWGPWVPYTCNMGYSS